MRLFLSLLFLFILMTDAAAQEVKALVENDSATDSELLTLQEIAVGKARVAYFQDSTQLNKEVLIERLGKASIFALWAGMYDRQLQHLNEGLALDPDDCILRMNLPYALALNNRRSEAEWEIRQHLQLNCTEKKKTLKIDRDAPLQGEYTMLANYREALKTYLHYQVAPPEKLATLSRLDPDSVQNAQKSIFTDTVWYQYSNLYRIIPQGHTVGVHNSPVEVVSLFISSALDKTTEYEQVIEPAAIPAAQLDFWVHKIQYVTFNSSYSLPGAPGFCRVQVSCIYFEPEIATQQTITGFFDLKWNGRQWIITNMPG